MPHWTTRRIFLATLVAACVVAGFFLLYRFRLVLFIVFAGIAVSMAIAPAVEMISLAERLKQLIDRAREEESIHDRSANTEPGRKPAERTASVPSKSYQPDRSHAKHQL